MKKHLLLILSFMLLSPPAAAQDKKLHVVASFSILGDMVEQVGGDDVIVKTLVGPDSDIHGYQPTPVDMQELAAADIIFTNGLGLESWIEKLLAASGTHAQIVKAASGVKARKVGGMDDPHAWQNLANAPIYINNISFALIAADPAHADAYRVRAESFRKEANVLDSDIRKQVGSIPSEKRKVISSHNAFGYFSEAYGVRFIAPVGMSGESEVSAAEIAQFANQIKSEKITHVFLENMADARLMRQMAKDTGANIGGILYSDALSAHDGPVPHYLDIFRHNVPLLTAAMIANGM